MGEMRARLARAPLVLYAAVVLATVMALAALVAHVLQAGGTSAATRPTALPRRADAAALAAAFGYPARCLSIAVSAADPDYAIVHVERTGACGNYRGYVNASFHRVAGAWRLIFDEGQLFVPNSLLTPLRAGSRRGGAVSDYPLGCVSVAIALHDPRFARADFDRTLRCGRSRPTATAAW
jgi:hypothetical protein